MSYIQFKSPHRFNSFTTKRDSNRKATDNHNLNYYKDKFPLLCLNKMQPELYRTILQLAAHSNVGS